MKIAILGAGALGSIYGAYLSKDNEVIMITRRFELCDAINTDGIRLYRDSEVIFEAKNPRAVIDSEEIGSVDLLIVLTKTYDTKNALESVLHCVGEGTTVLTLQNGMGNYETICDLVEKSQVLCGTSSQGGYVIGDARVCYAGLGTDNIGPMSGIGNERARSVYDVLKAAGFNVEYRDDIAPFLWKKLFINVGTNALTGILDIKNNDVLENEFIYDSAKTLIREAVEVANASGESFDLDEILDDFYHCIDSVRENRTSMCQDIARGRETEIESINGYIVKKAGELGINAPANKVITNLIHAKTKAIDGQVIYIRYAN